VDDMIFGRRYRVTEKIGSGGMAEVYKAVDETLGRTVAVKVMHAHYASDPEFAARFRQEAASAANLQHPSIVNIYDFGVEGDTPYIVMEFVRGTDLKTVLRQRGALDPHDVAEYGAQVCSALAVAHGYGIVHRDIKPHNIVLLPDGKSIKVMDFGIARAVDSDSTQTGSVLGTAQYVSPEQAQGKHLSGQSDLYSLGVVLYELSTGRLPFDGDTPVSVALKHVNETAVPPRRVNPAVPPALEAVILKAMEKDPSRRYRTADEMRSDLLRAAAGQPVGATPHADDTSVMPAVAAPVRAREAEHRHVPPKRSSNPWMWVGLVAILIVLGVGTAWAFTTFSSTGTQVPTTAGLTLAQAKTTIIQAGLKVGNVDTRPDDKIAKGNVIDTTPKAGAAANKGQVVDILVSSGPPLVTVPNVVGMSYKSAIATLTAAGLAVDPNITFTYDAKVKKDLVISQSLDGGGQVAKGSSIALTVSQGAEMVTVPDVTNKKESVATAALEKAGFVVNPLHRASATVAVGIVFDQKPPGGTAPKGSTVTIYVSTGPEQVTVPLLTDLTQAEAVAKLNALGLVADVQPITDPDPTHTGKVQSQSPGKDTKVDKGSTVTIKVAQL
jgi:eukaryotic-like serine/threonine-protein kinase